MVKTIFVDIDYSIKELTIKLKPIFWIAILTWSYESWRESSVFAKWYKRGPEENDELAHTYLYNWTAKCIILSHIIYLCILIVCYKIKILRQLL